jgi:hypothetical protein
MIKPRIPSANEAHTCAMTTMKNQEFKKAKTAMESSKMIV